LKKYKEMDEPERLCLLDAAYNGKWDAIKDLLKEYPPGTNCEKGSNLLMIAAFVYDFEGIQWVLENLDFDIEAVNDGGQSVLEATIEYHYYNEYTSFKYEEITPHLFFKMVALLLVVGNADAAPLWEFLLPLWEKEEVSTGEDEMLQNFIKTIYLFKRPAKSVEDALRATRHGYLLDGVLNQRRIRSKF
jgi:hypothetical protein